MVRQLLWQQLWLFGCVALMQHAAWADTQRAARVVRVGVVTQADTELVVAANPVQAGGVQLQAVPFANVSLARKALAASEIDASIAEDAQALASDPSACVVTPTVTYPLGLYATKIAAVREVPVRGRVALPGERVAQGRALLLLHHYGLIRLDRDAGLQPRVGDIVGNPRQLRFHTLPAASLAAALRSDALVAMPYAVADAAGLAPARDALGMEDARVPWANVLAVRAADCQADWVGHTAAAFHASPVKTFILARFNDSVRRPW